MLTFFTFHSVDMVLSRFHEQVHGLHVPLSNVVTAPTTTYGLSISTSVEESLYIEIGREHV